MAAFHRRRAASRLDRLIFTRPPPSSPPPIFRPQELVYNERRAAPFLTRFHFDPADKEPGVNLWRPVTMGESFGDGRS